MNDLEQLAAAEKVARAELSSVKREISEYEYRREEEFRTALASEVAATFGQRLEAARAANADAVRAHRAERDRLAKEGVGAKLPLGMRVVEWGRKCNYPWGKTGQVGIVEMFTADSQWPSNRRWGRPDIGETVVRILKKDGTPSLKCERLGHWPGADELPHGWFKEGVDPNKEKAV